MAVFAAKWYSLNDVIAEMSERYEENSMIDGNNKVLTLGVQPDEMEFVQEKFAVSGMVCDVTYQYEAVLAACGDIVIIVKDRIPAKAWKDIQSYRLEAGSVDDTAYYIFSLEQWLEAITVYRDEKALMKEWRQWWQNIHPEYDKFNPDGVVDYGRYFTMPDGKRILVILKETNELATSLSDFLFCGGSRTYYKTWNNVARWMNVIFQDEFIEYVPRAVLDDAVHNFAVMNIKKYAGGNTADKSEVKRIAKDDRVLLARQIRLYKPDLIITGGWNLVSDFVHDILLKEPKSNWYNPEKRADEAEPNLWYYWTKNARAGKKTLVVSMPHPNRTAIKWVLALQKVLHKEFGK